MQCDGETLMPFIRGETPDKWRSEAHWEFDWRHVPVLSGENGLGLQPDQCHLAAIRDDEYKYVHFPALPSLLFDLKKDPDQLVNLLAPSSPLDAMAKEDDGAEGAHGPVKQQVPRTVALSGDVTVDVAALSAEVFVLASCAGAECDMTRG